MNGFCGNKACVGIIERRPVLNDLLLKQRDKPHKSNQTTALHRNHRLQHRSESLAFSQGRSCFIIAIKQAYPSHT